MQTYSRSANSSEKHMRFRSLQRGFYEMGSFWKTCRDEQQRRLVFHSKVYYPSLDGLVSFVWSAKDSQDIDKHICICLRRALRGLAVEKEGFTVLRSLTNEQMMRRWQLAPHFWELRVLRLRMYQSWSRHPQDARQPIAALFGVFTNPKLTQLAQVDLLSGRVTYNIQSPWFVQFINDIHALKFMEEGLFCLQHLDGRYAFFVHGRFNARRFEGAFFCR